MGQVRDFKLPDLGEGLESGEIVAWHVDVGDHVELNQEICDVETAKAVVSVPCPFAGTIVERFGDIGEELEVGEPLVRIDVEEVADAADLPDEVADQVDDAGDGPAHGGSPAQAGFEVSGEAAGGERAEQDEPGEGERRNVLVGYGAAEGATQRRRRRGKQVTAGRREAEAPDTGGGNGEVAKPLAKPPVRKLAKDLGVDLAAIAPGSGEGGVITREDVRRASEDGGPTERPAAAPAAAPAAEAELAGIGFRGRRPGDVIPVSGIRKRIVEKMTTSRTEIPEATTTVTVDCTRLWDGATALTDAAQREGHDVRITPFALVARATVIALRRFPTLNARLDEDAGEIRLLEPIHLGVAVDTDRGLMVPVIGDAHRRTTLDLAREMARIVRAARDGSITPGDLTGGTFTVNNYGALGNDFGDPIINHPEAGILGVGAMNERPWVVDGELAVRRVVTLTIAFDHRISDGGEAGRFIAYIGELVEDPARILLHA
jgi:2-oxoisovalerate dehydrogenase E2 component (dihydrolipoyl transacylase)